MLLHDAVERTSLNTIAGLLDDMTDGGRQPTVHVSSSDAHPVYRFQSYTFVQTVPKHKQEANGPANRTLTLSRTRDDSGLADIQLFPVGGADVRDAH